jgi:hypothetical protein
MKTRWSWILAAAVLGLSPLARAAGRGWTTGSTSDDSTPPATDQTLTPSQALAAYPQRLADQPLSIGQGLAEGDIEGSYLFNPALGFQEVPTIRYGLTSKLELVLLGIRYTVAEDGQYYPGIAIRLQLHDLFWQEQPNSPDPYPILRPGVMVDAKDKLPFHLTAEGHIGYLVSFVTGNYLHGGGPIATANVESQEIVPMSVDLIYSPLDQLSFKGTFGFDYDVLALPDTPDQTEFVGRGDVIWTATNRFDLRIFFEGNWYDGVLGFVPQAGLGVTYRL